MATKLQLRRGTSTAWTAANPVLSQGEIGLETDSKKMKIGDGTTAWNSLAYAYSAPNFYLQTTQPAAWNVGDQWVDTSASI